MRRKPYSVILFDEIEKAHPDVSSVLLQILDDGRLTDGQGRTVDFKNTIVILTSNIGSEAILGSLGGTDPEAYEAMKRDVEGELRRRFRPEFLNRVDDIVVFHGLTRDDLRRIVDIQLARLRGRLADRQVTLELSDAAKDHFATAGFDCLMIMSHMIREFTQLFPSADRALRERGEKALGLIEVWHHDAGIAESFFAPDAENFSRRA